MEIKTYILLAIIIPFENRIYLHKILKKLFGVKSISLDINNLLAISIPFSTDLAV